MLPALVAQRDCWPFVDASGLIAELCAERESAAVWAEASGDEDVLPALVLVLVVSFVSSCWLVSFRLDSLVKLSTEREGCWSLVEQSDLVVELSEDRECPAVVASLSDLVAEPSTERAC